MRFKESLALDHLIDERRESLARQDDMLELDKRAMALAVLIEARDKLDEIGALQRPVTVRYHKRFTGTAEDGRKIRPRRRRNQRREHNVDDFRRHCDQQRQAVGDINVTVTGETNARDIARAIRREIRRGDGNCPI